jgi:hypothetical protein
VPEGSGARRVTRLELLDIRERRWAPLLRGVSLVAEAEIREADRTQAALALGGEYGKRQYSADKGIVFLIKWPACLVAAMTGVAVTSYAQGTYWPALWEAARYAGDTDDQQVWGTAFAASLSELGLPTFSDSPLHYVGPILMHAGIPTYCLSDFFRLLVERRRQDPGLDADIFLSWATAPRRQPRLSELDKPAERFLLNGGDYAHDIVDRTLDLLDRLTEPDPDFDAVRLPSYMIEAAKAEQATGRLDLSKTTRSTGNRTSATVRRQAQPRIALDPYGQGIHVLLPAVGDTPDGVARWKIAADGETSTVQSRAMWVGAAETTPQTAFPLDRPVRTVLVSLAGREDLAAELSVIDQADPVLFFGDDGRRLSATVSLPRSQVWIMHPDDRDLKFTGQPGQIVEPPVPFGWDGWRLCWVSLEDVQSVGLQGGRSHSVEVQARPRLLLGEPLPGVATPFGSSVYPVPPQLRLPQFTEAEIKWYAEIKRVGSSTPLVGRIVNPDDGVDIWNGVPRPILGAFEITVRGPLGRGLRRSVFVAEGLSVTYQPPVRLLTAFGLAKGEAKLGVAKGAAAQPATLRFGPGERARPIEYRTPTESEPLVITPPHVTVLCLGAGVTTWTTSLVHLATEDFADAGRLLIRVPAPDSAGQPGKNSQLELAVLIRGQQVQAIPASGHQSSGLGGFDLTRAADTVAAYKHAELAVDLGDVHMPVGYVRPRRLASGVDLAGDKLVLRDAAAVDGLTTGVYLVYAPWRPPTELPVAADGTASLPKELHDAGPLRVLLRIDDPWTVSSWPVWPGSKAYACEAPGVPRSADLEEESLSRFVASQGELPKLMHHLGWLWRLVDQAPALIDAGARTDLAERCTSELRRQLRAALLALADEDLSQADVTHALITTGLAAAPPDTGPWQPDEQRTLERLWAALPAAAAIAVGDLFSNDDLADAAIVQCGDSLTEILKGHADPDAAVGRFGPEAERMAAWPPEQVDALWQAAAVVPRAMLDADTRLMAARRMFDARHEQPMRAASAFAKMIMRTAETLIRQSRYPDLADAISARQPAEGKSGWLALPAMSVAMALLARLAARGNSNAALLEQEYRGKWSNLALRAPELVAIDLVLAEALVTAALDEKADDPEEPHD